jgi:hypothetical protein
MGELSPTRQRSRSRSRVGAPKTSPLPLRTRSLRHSGPCAFRLSAFRHGCGCQELTGGPLGDIAEVMWYTRRSSLTDAQDTGPWFGS